MTNYDPLTQPVVIDTWREKYRHGSEPSWEGTCERVVGALCARETPEIQDRTLAAMLAREIVPAGRILAGAGTGKRVTKVNCFTSSLIQDSMATEPDRAGKGIMDALAGAAYSLQMGGGVGMDFSTIRPRGAVVKRTASVSSGVLPFMDMWNAMSETIMSAGHRRGAMMGTLRCLHGSTKIHTVDGNVPIADLVGKRPYVFACDPNTRRVRVVRADRVFVSDRRRRVVKVRFDTRSDLICTPDHLIMLKSGAFRPAGQLRVGDRVMAIEHGASGYRQMPEGHNKVTETVRCTGGRTDCVYRIVAEDVLLRRPEGYKAQVHHRDWNRLHNHPRNLEILSVSEHATEHAAENVVLLAEYARGEGWADVYGEDWASQRRERQKAAIKKAWRDGKMARRRNPNNNRKGKSWEEIFGEEKAARMRKSISAAAKRQARRYRTARRALGGNHRVIAVEECGVAGEVYDIKLPKWHNFAANEVFVHNCDHPDIEEFIAAKHQPGRLTNFNVSILVTDDFLKAVRVDAGWKLAFPVPPAAATKRLRVELDGVSTYVYKTVRARELWDKIISSTYVHAEPGVVFIDRVNELNNLRYCEHIHALNPCFAGGTLVRTIRGDVSFAELAALGKTVPVLTQLDDGTLAYRDMVRPRVTRRRARLVEVRLRRGARVRGPVSAIRCTPNHEFFLTDGTRRRAADLRPGDRIDSVYWYSLNKGYVRIANTRDTCQEHWLTAEYKYGRRPDYPREHAHHVNGIKHDNAPENVEILEAAEHDALNMRGDLNPIRRFPDKNHFKTARFTGAKNGMYGRKHSAETRAKIGAKTRERAADPAYKERWLEARNHRVASVEFVEEREDVYCGTVPSTGRFFVVPGPGEGVLVSNCGEQMLPDDGCCDLGHVNLATVVLDPFERVARVDTERLRRSAHLMVRLLDNVLDETLWPTPAQADEARSKRRIGLGFTGLGTALQMLGIPYGSSSAVETTSATARLLAGSAYRASCGLARERGSFPLYREEEFCAAPLVQKLDQHYALVSEIRESGIRNGVLLSVAPTGTTSLAIGNVSSGVEPIFAHRYRRRVRGTTGSMDDREYSVFDYGFLKYCERVGADPETYEPGGRDDEWGFVTAEQVSVEKHLQMAAAAQEWVDSAVSKTINCPESTTFEEFRAVYDRAYELGMKGCTTYRPDPRSGRGAVLIADGREVGRPDSVQVNMRGESFVAMPVYVTIHDYVATYGTASVQGTWSGSLPRTSLEATYHFQPRAELPSREMSVGPGARPAPESAAPRGAADKVPMQDVVDARRYRIKWPTEDCAYYVIITDYVDGEGRRRPFELFVSTKSERHSEWVRAFSLLVTAIFRREGDPAFVLDELRSVFSASGGAWMRVPWSEKTKYIPSLVAAVGLKIEEHMRWLGLIGSGEELVSEQPDDPVIASGASDAVPPPLGNLAVCDKCGARAVVYSEGCSTCLACGASDCG